MSTRATKQQVLIEMEWYVLILLTVPQFHPRTPLSRWLQVYNERARVRVCMCVVVPYEAGNAHACIPAEGNRWMPYRRLSGAMQTVAQVEKSFTEYTGVMRISIFARALVCVSYKSGNNILFIRSHILSLT